MTSPTNPTLKFPQKQPQNGRYGRLPLDLLPKILSLSNQEAKVFMVLSMLANFKREPIGMVECQSFSDLANMIGIRRTSLYRAVAGLVERGMVTRTGRDTCLMVRHYLSHEETPVSHEETGGVSSGDTISPQPQPSIDTYAAPIRSEEVSEEEATVVVAELPVKTKKKHSPSWLVWDSEREILTSRNGDSNGNQEFMKRWKERLGEEDIIWTEKDLAEKWLRENPEKRIRVKRFDRFFGNWLEKRWEAS